MTRTDLIEWAKRLPPNSHKKIEVLAMIRAATTQMIKEEVQWQDQ